MVMDGQQMDFSVFQDSTDRIPTGFSLLKSSLWVSYPNEKWRVLNTISQIKFVKISRNCFQL